MNGMPENHILSGRGRLRKSIVHFFGQLTQKRGHLKNGGRKVVIQAEDGSFQHGEAHRKPISLVIWKK